MVSFKHFALAAIVASALGLSGCGYNDMATGDQGVKAAWSEVVNQYQRRADLVPNIVNTVKGYATQEKEVLEAVTNARASATSIKATPELVNDPAAFKKFIDAQGQLQGSLSRLLAVAENYPQLKSDALFRDLVGQLEGTENRITVARKRYIDTIRLYNNNVVSFPSNITAMIFGFKEKPQFTVENEAAISTAPKVDFNKPAAPATPAPAK
jgi:LemA protein